MVEGAEGCCESVVAVETCGGCCGVEGLLWVLRNRQNCEMAMNIRRQRRGRSPGKFIASFSAL